MHIWKSVSSSPLNEALVPRAGPQVRRLHHFENLDHLRAFQVLFCPTKLHDGPQLIRYDPFSWIRGPCGNSSLHDRYYHLSFTLIFSKGMLARVQLPIIIFGSRIEVLCAWLTSRHTQAKEYMSLFGVLWNLVRSQRDGSCNSGAIHLTPPWWLVVAVDTAISAKFASPKSARRTCPPSSMRMFGWERLLSWR